MPETSKFVSSVKFTGAYAPTQHPPLLLVGGPAENNQRADPLTRLLHGCRKSNSARKILYTIWIFHSVLDKPSSLPQAHQAAL